MKIVSWQEWLDKHIPYYEAERHRTRFLANPPHSVLIIEVTDRAVRHIPGTIRETWEDIHNKMHELHFDFSPLFLERDTHQEWYWAFWNEHEALVTVLKLG
jgi:hypothetical protein